MIKGLLILNLLTSTAYAQGLFNVSPLSQFSDRLENRNIYIYGSNPDRESTGIYVENLCDVDGKTYKGQKCSKWFNISYNTPEDNGLLNVSNKDRTQMTVSLNEKPEKYALFTPNIQDARKIKKHSSTGGSMFFGYKPAVLFLLSVDKKSKPVIRSVDKKKANKGQAQVVNISVDYRKLKTPRVISMTARFSSGDKQLKIVRLLDRNIVDTSKKIMNYGAEVAEKPISGKICYNIYIAYNFDKSGIDKLSGCTQ